MRREFEGTTVLNVRGSVVLREKEEEEESWGEKVLGVLIRAWLWGAYQDEMRN